MSIRPIVLWQHVVNHIKTADGQRLPCKVEMLVFARHGVCKYQVERLFRHILKPYARIIDYQSQSAILPQTPRGDIARLFLR